ncbi:YTH domain-containing protein 1-like [Lacerta agilis]|uniref:YTH domain-containing protein 1-like n=1 Tax=Lacerta agilis TaxID=80427 RepID=UPI001419844A|nr:YTH domain-containing protein 1-like [Lacerta agilis]
MWGKLRTQPVSGRQVENTPLCLETGSTSAEERRRRRRRKKKVSGAKAETEEVGESPGSRSKARAPEQENLNGAKGVEKKVERDEEEGEDAEESEKSEVKTEQELDREIEVQKEGVGEARRRKIKGEEASEDGMSGRKANKGRRKGSTSKPGCPGGSRKRKAKEDDGGMRKKRKKEEECGKEDKWKWYVLRSGCQYYF